MSTPHWPDIQRILDESMRRWEETNGRSPKMSRVHDGPIGWSTKEQLLNSIAYGLRLIAEDKIGVGKAEETNLVKILRRSIGGWRRMPSRGPFLPDQDINTIAEWIDAGVPD